MLRDEVLHGTGRRNVEAVTSDKVRGEGFLFVGGRGIVAVYRAIRDSHGGGIIRCIRPVSSSPVERSVSILATTLQIRHERKGRRRRKIGTED